MKRMAIIATPIFLLGAVSYVSLMSQSKAHQSAFAYERYYDEYSDGEDEYNDKKLFPEGNDDMNGKGITSHDSVPLDSDPKSITVLVNKELSLPEDYIPEDLVVPNVLFSISYYNEKKLLRREAAKALEELFQVAEEEDSVILYGVSGYRSYQRQYDIFTSNIRKKGIDHTSQYSAKPGYSEHQTGLSIDVSAKSAKNRLESSFANTKEGKWLASNAHKYGFIIRYSKDKKNITGYSYEPWHIRYVGRELAMYLFENDLCLEEYYNFEPSIDYDDEISYDNLVDFGIDIDDVLTKPVPTSLPSVTPLPTEKPTLTPTPVVTEAVTPTPIPTEIPIETEIPTETETPVETETPTEPGMPTATPPPMVTEIPLPTESPVDDTVPSGSPVPTEGLPSTQAIQPITGMILE